MYMYIYNYMYIEPYRGKIWKYQQYLVKMHTSNYMYNT